MKTTNFENSKKLADIGFDTYTQFYHSADAKCISKGEDADDYELICNDLSYSKIAKNYNIPSYDLETILEALPSSVEGMVFGLEKTMIGYGNTKTFKIYEEVGNESLADTAARLLIALAEKKIINFK